MEANEDKRVRIYKLTNTQTDLIYVGATTRTLKCRLINHLSEARRFKKSYLLYKHMVDVGSEHFRIELLEEKECESKQEQLNLEQKWMDELNPGLNRYKASPTDEDRKATKKKYADAHRPELRAKSKRYYHSVQKHKALQQCACGMTFRLQNKSRHLKSARHKANLFDQQE